MEIWNYLIDNDWDSSAPLIHTLMGETWELKHEDQYQDNQQIPSSIRQILEVGKIRGISPILGEV